MLTPAEIRKLEASQPWPAWLVEAFLAVAKARELKIAIVFLLASLGACQPQDISAGVQPAASRAIAKQDPSQWPVIGKVELPDDYVIAEGFETFLECGYPVLYRPEGGEAYIVNSELVATPVPALTTIMGYGDASGQCQIQLTDGIPTLREIPQS